MEKTVRVNVDNDMKFRDSLGTSHNVVLTDRLGKTNEDGLTEEEKKILEDFRSQSTNGALQYFTE